MHRFYFSVIAALGFIGILVAGGAHICALGHAKDVADTLLLGVPFALIGAVGYLTIGLTALMARSSRSKWGLFPIFNYILVTFAGGFTVFLVMRAVEVGMVCPGCLLSWMLTITLFVSTFWFIFTKRVTIETREEVTFDDTVGLGRRGIIVATVIDVDVDCENCEAKWCPEHPSNRT
ncbi:MAG: hypothetical protein HOA57_00560 [Candidatus Magasanikbacteria bacterium]|nr:hypothetical protein [Candidatus Magasanikbacteria bacterium]MBT4315330.1 hypothetical protein [Candidatus Magasanikbacteria bacterium]MBT4547202.1 hypothetical protein [Candidatus Magasanikbacteria bacterium]MBT6818866.1 hypothetical protein [Candidatus Magasanikbacteria bacterium]